MRHGIDEAPAPFEVGEGISTEWLDRKLRAAMFMLRQPVPERQWPDIVSLWVLMLGDVARQDVLKQIALIVASDDITLLNPQRIKDKASGQASLKNIASAVCEVAKIHRNELMSHRRERRIARPRQAAMWVAKASTEKSLPEIGRYFGGRDHTTVIHACRQIDSLITKDPEVRDMVRDIQAHAGIS